MIFSSLQFLFLFLPIVLLGYYIIPTRFLNIWLLISSIVFYYLSARNYVWLLLVIISIAHISGYVLARIYDKFTRKLILVLSLIVMLTFMCYYKYSDFVMKNINMILHRDQVLVHTVLPIGISFFVFQAVSYVVDSYRYGTTSKNFFDTALYISFFPQLIAGPIVRYSDIQSCLEVERREKNFDRLSSGMWRFFIGLCKKVIIADTLGSLVDIVFGVTDIHGYSVLYAWLGAIAFALQIYYDFSGYSDMAIGLGHVFGFEIKENFNYPYAARSIKDFWERWYISLSNFFKEYVYIPLGGNRCKKSRWIFNMMVVWFLTGLWHGASWTFMIWGLLYGVILVIERFYINRKIHTLQFVKISNRIGHVYTLFLVCILWVIFRSQDIWQATAFISVLIGKTQKGFYGTDFLFLLQNYAFVLIIAVIFSMSIIPKIKQKIENDKLLTLFQYGSSIAIFIGVVVSFSMIYMNSYSPFLYFMF